jgi:hypothetical protein
MDIETLADLIINRAMMDKTSPDPSNQKNGWTTDVLFQAIDSLVVVHNNDPVAYAEIGRQVLTKVQDLPEMAVLAQLAILRGERRQAVSLRREEIILQLAREVEKAISALPDGTTRKMRCKSLFEYHMGIFYEDYGCFNLAAKAHAQAAEEANRFSDLPGAAISRFMETLCILKDALRMRIGKPSDELDTIFSKLETRFVQLIEALRGSALEVQWTKNSQAHMMEACVLLGRNPARYQHIA